MECLLIVIYCSIDQVILYGNMYTVWSIVVYASLYYGNLYDILALTEFSWLRLSLNLTLFHMPPNVIHPRICMFAHIKWKLNNLLYIKVNV